MDKENCEVTLYRCSTCGNLVEMVNDSGMNMVCCGKPMSKQVPGSTDGAIEKHVPVYTIEDDLVKVQVGSEMHPMTDEHHICFVILLTDCGVYRKNLRNHDTPVVTFKIDHSEKVLKVYEYCNLHGLFVSNKCCDKAK